MRSPPQTTGAPAAAAREGEGAGVGLGAFVHDGEGFGEDVGALGGVDDVDGHPAGFVGKGLVAEAEAEGHLARTDFAEWGRAGALDVGAGVAVDADEDIGGAVLAVGGDEGLKEEPRGGGTAQVGDGDEVFVDGGGEVFEALGAGEAVLFQHPQVDDDGAFLGGEGAEAGGVSVERLGFGEGERGEHGVEGLCAFEGVGAHGDDAGLDVLAFGQEFAAELGGAEGLDEVLAAETAVVEGLAKGGDDLRVGVGGDDDAVVGSAASGEEKGEGGKEWE